MSCSHCCYSCNKNDGEDMAFETFKMILEKWGNKITEQDKRNIIIGGGEPTTHPEFWKFVTIALSYGTPWIATNGKKTKDALLLAELGKRNTISSVLSLDKWHETIDECVVDAFKRGLVKYEELYNTEHSWIKWMSPNYDLQGMREIRSIKIPYRRGECTKGPDQCACSYIRVSPNGLIYGCGCITAPIIGTVLNGIFDRFENVPWYDSCSLTWAIL